MTPEGVDTAGHILYSNSFARYVLVFIYRLAFSCINLALMPVNNAKMSSRVGTSTPFSLASFNGLPKITSTSNSYHTLTDTLQII